MTFTPFSLWFIIGAFVEAAIMAALAFALRWSELGVVIAFILSLSFTLLIWVILSVI